MTDEEQQRYLDAVRAEAWTEHIYPRVAVGSRTEPAPSGCFARTSAVYERELRSKLDERAAVARGAANIFQAVSQARDVAYEMLDQLVSGPEREDVLRIVAELDKVLGPDLVREADPTGKVLKSLPFDERKRILDAFDREDTGQPIIIVEDEFPKLLREHHKRLVEVSCSRCSGQAFAYDGVVQRHRMPNTGIRCDGAGTTLTANEDVVRGEGE